MVEIKWAVLVIATHSQSGCSLAKVALRPWHGGILNQFLLTKFQINLTSPTVTHIISIQHMCMHIHMHAWILTEMVSAIFNSRPHYGEK